MVRNSHLYYYHTVGMGQEGKKKTTVKFRLTAICQFLALTLTFNQERHIKCYSYFLILFPNLETYT